MMNTRSRFITPVILLILGVALLFVTSDREFINLAPTEGAPFAAPLVFGKEYKQQFIVHSKTLTRLGLYFSVGDNAPANPVHVVIAHGDEVLSVNDLPAVFIDSDRPSQIVFNPPLELEDLDAITATITVPKELSGIVKLQLREIDESFNADDAVFYIDDTKQENPLAYQAYFSYKPPFSLQLGFLLILISILLAFHVAKPFVLTDPMNNKLLVVLWISSIVLAHLFVIPAQLLGGRDIFLLVVSQSAAFLGIALLLLNQRVTFLSAIFSAQIFAFTTWFALHVSAGRQLYALAALIPLTLVLLSKKQTLLIAKQKGYLAALLLISALGIFVIAKPAPINMDLTAVASMKDVFLDPNQIPSSQKLYPTLAVQQDNLNEMWDNFGSYIGVPALILAVIGFFAGFKKYWKIVILGALFMVIAFYKPVAMFLSSFSPIPPQHAAVLTTLVLAFFAGIGFNAIHLFLRKDDRIVFVILSTTIIIALLDMWHVAAGSLEFGLL